MYRRQVLLWSDEENWKDRNLYGEKWKMCTLLYRALWYMYENVY